MVDRIAHLRPIGVTYVWTVAASLIATGTSGIHPLFGRAWDAVAIVGAITLLALPFAANATHRAAMVTVVAFVLIAHAIEYLRLTQASPVGISVCLLWVAALAGVVSQAAADQELHHRVKLPPAE